MHEAAIHYNNQTEQMSKEEFCTIAKDLESLSRDPTATLHFEVMSNALVWSDEVLRNRRARETWCMRPVFRYRTGLIMGLDFDEFREDWRIAKTIFPRWIGFSADRCDRSNFLEERYYELSKKKRL